ncbi:MAG: hypothetical protein ABJG15_09895 [Hyphomonadaceae bacterium]
MPIQIKLKALAACCLFACTSADSVPREDIEALECHAATASVLAFNAIVNYVKEGGPALNISSIEDFPPSIQQELEPSLRAVKRTFPSSDEHVAEFSRLLSVNMGIIEKGLSSGDFSFTETIENKTESCENDYPN